MLDRLKMNYHSYIRRIFSKKDETKISKEITFLAKQNNIKIFLETGTYFGDTTNAVKYYFENIYSIELSSHLAELAKKRFSKHKNIKIYNGDSSQVLKGLLNNIDERIIFWLDGHFSGGVTAKGKVDTPILDELLYIINHKIKNHIILVDDARLFNGTDGYPTIDEVKKLFQNTSYNSIEVKKDIIYIL